MGWYGGIAGGCGVHNVGICACALGGLFYGLPGWDKYHVRVGV